MRKAMYNYYQGKFTGKQIDDAIGAVLEGRVILLTNCPNCGAPIEDGKCPYCGTSFMKQMQEAEP